MESTEMARPSTRDESTAVRVTVLETQVNTLAVNLDKIETKIDANYQTLHTRISDLRDDINQSIEVKHDRVMQKLDEQNASATQQHKAISDKIQVIEKWRWMIMGGALVLGYVLAHLKIEKLF